MFCWTRFPMQSDCIPSTLPSSRRGANLRPTELGRVCKGFKPESDHADGDHGEIVDGALFVAGGDAAELLEAIDQPLDEVAPPIRLTVEARLAALVALGRNDRCDPAAADPAARCRAAVAFVARHTARAQPRSTATPARHC